MKPKPFMNPYLAGFILGMVLLFTIYVTGRGLGASGGVKSVVMAVVKNTAPDHYGNTAYYQSYEHQHPRGTLNSWLFFEILGVLVGAFFSGVMSRRVGLTLERGPRAARDTRIVAALAGGALFGFGSQLGRGCTSGSALSGMAVMSMGGILTMLAIFGSAYALAYFFKKLWLKY